MSQWASLDSEQEPDKHSQLRKPNQVRVQDPLSFSPNKRLWSITVHNAPRTGRGDQKHSEPGEGQAELPGSTAGGRPDPTQGLGSVGWSACGETAVTRFLKSRTSKGFLAHIQLGTSAEHEHP